MSPSEVAAKYIHQEEIAQNKGFKDPAFAQKMKDVGFSSGQAWCAYFAELVFKEAFPEKKAELDKLFSASATQTFKNFEKAGYKVSAVPVKNSLVIWEHIVDGKASWQGHAGICIEAVSQFLFKSVEGNTNSTGGREGFEVALKSKRTTVRPNNGLGVKGFIIIE